MSTPFNSRLPYNIAMVDLDDGPRLMTTILTDWEPRLGDRVAFETVPRDNTLDAPVFRPITTAEKAEAHDRDH